MQIRELTVTKVDLLLETAVVALTNLVNILYSYMKQKIIQPTLDRIFCGLTLLATYRTINNEIQYICYFEYPLDTQTSKNLNVRCFDARSNSLKSGTLRKIARTASLGTRA